MRDKHIVCLSKSACVFNKTWGRRNRRDHKLHFPIKCKLNRTGQRKTDQYGCPEALKLSTYCTFVQISIATVFWRTCWRPEWGYTVFFIKKGQSWTLTMALNIQTVSSEAVGVLNTFYSISIHVCTVKLGSFLVRLDFIISFIKTSALKWMEKHLNTSQYSHFFQ